MTDGFDTDYLVIVAHPDDAEFGCAGSVINWTDSGKKVAYVLCTSGGKGSSDPEVNPEQLAALREQEQLAAADAAGVGKVIFLRYPDQGLEDTAEFRKNIVRQIRIHRPRTVITMDPYHKYIWHRDHRITGQAVLDAVFPYARDPLAYPDLMAASILPHKVREIWFFGSEDINHQVDITTSFERKIEALFYHVSQVEGMGRENVLQRVKSRCEKMAEGTDFKYAEGFHRVKIPR